jgi:hypothetical protein
MQVKKENIFVVKYYQIKERFCKSIGFNQATSFGSIKYQRNTVPIKDLVFQFKKEQK